MKKQLLWVLFILPLALFSQKKIQNADSLLVVLSKSKTDTSKINTLNKLSVAYVRVDSSKGLYYARQALKLAQAVKWHEGIADSYFYIATQYLAGFNYNKALVFFDKSIQITKDKRLQSKIFTGMGSCYIYESNYSKALESYHRALKIDEALGDRKGIGKSAMNIASVYYSIRDYPKSIAFFNKSLNQKNDDPYFNSMLLRNLGAVYNSMGQLQKALGYFDRSLLLCEKIKNDAFKASLLSDIALVYYDLEDYDKAIRYSKASLKIGNMEVEDKVNTAFSFGVIGDSYIEKAKLEGNKRILLDSAVHSLNKSIALHRQLNSIRGLYDDYTSLTEAQKLQGNYQTAIQSYETSITYKDSIFNSENRETIKNIEDKRSIELRDKELKINKLTLQAKERHQWYLTAGLALLVIIGILLFYQSNSRKQTNRKLHLMNADLDRANTVKTRLLSILNHDLRSPVNSFIHYIQFRRELPELLDEAAKIRIENTTLASAKNLLDSMEDMLLWTKDQMKNFEPQPQNIAIQSVFEDTAKHFSGGENTAITFENPENIELFTDENYLKTIIRNLTGNAIKALKETANPAVVWKAWQQNEAVFLSISDNGPGATDEQLRALYDETEMVGVQSGLGLHLIRDLAKTIHCDISVASAPGNGTTFVLAFNKNR